MPVLNEGEILARVHKFKLFREEGNLFIDLYEALMGNPASKFIAVPNLIIREADKQYFGFGESKSEALKDCLKKIKDVPIHGIVPLDNDVEKDKTLGIYAGAGGQFKRLSRPEMKNQTIKPLRSLGKIYGTVLDSSRPHGSMKEIITAREENPKGVPIRNAKITAECKGVGKKKTRTDDSGYYEFTDLEDGVWRLKIKAKGYEIQEAEAEIVGGGEHEENFT